MGRTYVRTLSDCEKHGLVLEIVCQRCMRAAYRGARDLIGMKVGSQVIYGHMVIDTLAPALKCRGGRGVIGCGAKAAEIRACWPHELPKVPAGVPVIAFLNADDRERKRMIRQARG